MDCEVNCEEEVDDGECEYEDDSNYEYPSEEDEDGIPEPESPYPTTNVKPSDSEIGTNITGQNNGVPSLSSTRGVNSSSGSNTTAPPLNCVGNEKILIADVDGVRSHSLHRIIDQVSKLLYISYDESFALLIHHKWNKEKLVELYFENAQQIRTTVGIDLYQPCTYGSHKRSRNVHDTEDDTLICCEVCYDDVPPTDTIALGCHHSFCVTCFRTYLKTQVSNGPPGCLITKCPHFKCTQLVPHSYFRTLLFTYPDSSTDEVVVVPSSVPTTTTDSTATDSSSLSTKALYEKYEAYCLRNLIENSRLMNFCRAPHCELISIAIDAAYVEEVVKCACGHQYCFKCGEIPHQPCSCQQLSLWNEKCSNESETANWIMTNTKKCPKCSVRIEKNQGCNHMTCRSCSHHFCWLCFGK